MKYLLFFVLLITLNTAQAEQTKNLNNFQDVKNQLQDAPQMGAETQNFIDKHYQDALTAPIPESSPLAKLKPIDKHPLEFKLQTEDRSAETRFSPREIKFIKRF